MSKPLHNHKSDADFVLEVAKRLRSVSVSYGLNGFDIDCLGELSSRLRKEDSARKEMEALVGDKPAPYLACEYNALETTDQVIVDADSTLFKEATPEGGVIRLAKWPEGYVLWFHGKIVWRSWRNDPQFYPLDVPTGSANCLAEPQQNRE